MSTQDDVKAIEDALKWAHDMDCASRNPNAKVRAAGCDCNVEEAPAALARLAARVGEQERRDKVIGWLLPYVRCDITKAQPSDDCSCESCDLFRGAATFSPRADPSAPAPVPAPRIERECACDASGPCLRHEDAAVRDAALEEAKEKLADWLGQMCAQDKCSPRMVEDATALIASLKSGGGR